MSTGPYAEAARRYWAAGWANPIPVKGKGHPAAGYTGYDGANVSFPDLQAWIDGDEAGHNIALRLPGDVVGIDVDAYDDKTGDASLAAAEVQLGPLPATARSTSRAPFEPSGIRFYRVPTGTNLRGAEKRFRARFGDHVDIIRRDHRYAVVWPSVHPDTGGTYQWYGVDGEACGIPRPADLAELPAAWVEFLTVPQDQVTGAHSGTHVESPSTASDASPWDLPRQFTREQAIEFVRPHFEALRAAPNGTINNRLNDAAVAIGHFVPLFWSRVEATRYLLDAVAQTVYDGRTWRAESTIVSGLGANTWRAELIESPPVGELPAGRRVDLGPYLDGSYVAPEPTVGALRDDGRAMLYPGRWHTLIAPTASGKSWMLVAHARDVLLSTNGIVAYLHFEEIGPIGTIERLRALGVPVEIIRDRFVWLDCERGWKPGEVGAALAALGPAFVALDGINAACSRHGFDVEKTTAVGQYRDLFVTPAVALGAAVLSAGHPPKARDRKDERHGFGSTAWLDEVDGVGFRLVAGKSPIRRGQFGSSAVYSVKDRYGSVERLGTADGQSDGWVYLGSLCVDDTASVTSLRISVPDRSIAAEKRDPNIDAEDAVIDVLRDLGSRGQEANLRTVEALTGIRKDRTDDAIERLKFANRIRETRGARSARVFHLSPEINSDEVDSDDSD